MTTRRGLVRRIVGFGALPVLSALSPLIALPILARLATVDQWSAIAIGQSVGGIGAIAVSAGWSVTGAPLAAQSDEQRRRLLLVESLSSRLLAATAVLPIAAIAAAVIAGGSVLSAMSAVAAALTGFSISWYAIGTGRPRALALVETIPRVVVNIVAAATASALHEIALYPVATGATAIIPVLAYYLRMTREVRRPGWLRGGPQRLLANAAAVGTEVVAAAYSMGATAIVGLASTTAVVAHFNAGYRLTAMGSIAIATVSNSLQGWTAEARGEQFRRRIRIAAGAHLTVGLLGLVGLAVLGPWAAHVLFGGRLAPGRPLLIWLGAFFLFWSLETLTSRLILAARGLTRALLWTTAVGSCFGVVAIYALAHWRGASGAGAGLACALGLIVALQTRRAWRAYRSDE